MAKICRVIPMNLNQLVYEKVHNDHRLANKAYLSAISQSFQLQDGGKNQLSQIRNKIMSLSPGVYSK